MEQRYAVITGGAGSLGSNVARMLVKKGVKVFVLDRDAEAGSALAEELGDMVVIKTLDATDPRQVDVAVAEILVATGGTINYLVNGISKNPFTPIAELSYEEMFASVNATLLSHAYLAHCFAGKLVPGGSIVNVSSVHALQTRKGFAIYAAGKGGVNALTRGLALEFRDDRIRVNAVVPGAFMNARTAITNKKPDWQEQVAKGQMFKPEDIAQVVVFLVSDEAIAINGECVVCDGGVAAERMHSNLF